MAISNVMIDNNKTRVTMWSFEVGDETGQHIHELDYVIVPMLDGDLKIIDHNGSTSISQLKKGICYFREKGVNHNVINNNNFPYSFIEVEIISFVGNLLIGHELGVSSSRNGFYL